MSPTRSDIFFCVLVIKSYSDNHKSESQTERNEKFMIKKTGGFEKSTEKESLVIKVRGEIDHHSAVDIRGDIDKLIYELRPRRLVLDLSVVDFMDSSGLGLIMGRYSVMSRLGGETVLRDPSAAILKIIKLAGLERMIRIEKSKDHPRSGKEGKKQ